MYSALPRDVYVDDEIHYWLSVELGALVADEQHSRNGLWYWRDAIPDGRKIDPRYELSQ
jgi:hypothetical protein